MNSYFRFRNVHYSTTREEILSVLLKNIMLRVNCFAVDDSNNEEKEDEKATYFIAVMTVAAA